MCFGTSSPGWNTSSTALLRRRIGGENFASDRGPRGCARTSRRPSGTPLRMDRGGRDGGFGGGRRRSRTCASPRPSPTCRRRSGAASRTGRKTAPASSGTIHGWLPLPASRLWITGDSSPPPAGGRASRSTASSSPAPSDRRKVPHVGLPAGPAGSLRDQVPNAVGSSVRCHPLRATLARRHARPTLGGRERVSSARSSVLSHRPGRGVRPARPGPIAPLAHESQAPGTQAPCATLWPMAERHVEHLLIGGGIASANCALELRDRGAEGQILLVGRELDSPYHRPPITKEYLRGEIQREQALIERPELFEERQIELLTRTSVTALDPDARRATLSTKDQVTYDTALIATGAMVRRLQVAGADLQGIHYLRALGNADSLRRELDQVEEAVLIGGSYIACEVAASLTALGKRCTQVMLESVVFERGFGHTAGAYFQGVLEHHGIEVLGSEEVEGFEPPDGEQVVEGCESRVGTLCLQSGRRLPAQLVVAGVGAIPDVMLARRAGLEIG
ncbi:MAG: FAD-dependent oxidoreductase, partial [Actinobacteria bacterium]